MYYQVSVDKKTIKRVENKNHWSFSQVKVTAGKAHPADADYKNLIWRTVPESGKVKKNNLLATTATWGPLFWVSMDVILHNPVSGWTSLLAFQAHDAKESMQGRFPGIFVNKGSPHDASHMFHIVSSVNGNPGHYFDYPHVEPNRWYNVVIQQISRNGKERNYTIVLSLLI